MRVLLAGGTGAIGREIAGILRAKGHFVRLLARSAQRATLAGAIDEVRIADALDAQSLLGAADSIDVVVSALGANVGLSLKEWRSYGAVDVRANSNLLAEAVRAGVKRFVYVGVHTAPGYDQTRYVVAHERFVDQLRRAPLSSTVVRPTGVYSAITDFVDMARRGTGSVVGDGSARTNPIHPLDVAEQCVAHLESGPSDVPVGGPDVLTRKELALLAFEAIGKKPKLMHAPPWIFLALAFVMRALHPRLADLFQFVSRVSTHDAVAPVVGRRRLLDYFREYAEKRSA